MRRTDVISVQLRLQMIIIYSMNCYAKFCVVLGDHGELGRGVNISYAYWTGNIKGGRMYSCQCATIVIGQLAESAPRTEEYKDAEPFLEGKHQYNMG